MKRLVQFVALIVVVLLAAQPAHAYFFCGQAPCVGSACSLACCGDMPGMGDSMGPGMDCSAMMEALPAGFGCGLSSQSMAAITREAAITGPAAGNNSTPDFSSVYALTSSASARAGGASNVLSLVSRDPLDRGVLYRVFRI
jgi:hypothetical protein